MPTKGEKKKAQKVCAVILAKAFPDFAEDESFVGELAERVLTVCVNDATLGPADLYVPLEDALAGTSDAEAILAIVHFELVSAGLVKVSEAPAEAAVERMAPSGISTRRFESIFSKELKKRERAGGKHMVSAEALACEHCWDTTGCGGVVCQICNFETKVCCVNSV